MAQELTRHGHRSWSCQAASSAHASFGRGMADRPRDSGGTAASRLSHCRSHSSSTSSHGPNSPLTTLLEAEDEARGVLHADAAGEMYAGKSIETMCSALGGFGGAAGARGVLRASASGRLRADGGSRGRSEAPAAPRFDAGATGGRPDGSG